MIKKELRELYLNRDMEMIRAKIRESSPDPYKEILHYC